MLINYLFIFQGVGSQKLTAGGVEWMVANKFQELGECWSRPQVWNLCFRFQDADVKQAENRPYGKMEKLRNPCTERVARSAVWQCAPFVTFTQ